MNARAELGARQKGERMHGCLLAAKRLPSVFFDSNSTILVMNWTGRYTEKEEESWVAPGVDHCWFESHCWLLSHD